MIGKPIGEYASRVSTAGVDADSPSLIALAQAVDAEFRIFAWEPSLNRWQLYVD